MLKFIVFIALLAVMVSVGVAGACLLGYHFISERKPR